MSRLIVLLFVLVALAFPLAGRAQAQSTLEKRSEEIFGMSQENVLTIGAGVIVGAFAGHLLVPVDLAYIGGAAIGGFLANWWYQNGGEPRLRALLRKSSAPAVTLASAVVPAPAVLR
jgi:hypothetical protein